MHGYVGDWGWSIIVLTILINLAMAPLRHKSVVSMRRMQELQPQMKAIQDRYAKYKITDPERQKMNTEVMELYKSRGVNPASGCVPMLLTMPFLFAFYAMLGQAIEIRGEDFLGWIPDLSRADPYYITPVLMGVCDVLADADHAEHGRSDAAEDHDVHADHDHGHDAVRAGGAGDLLAGEQHLDDRPAVLHQLDTGAAENGSPGPPAAVKKK